MPQYYFKVTYTQASDRQERRILTKALFTATAEAAAKEILYLGGKPLQIRKKKIRFWEREYISAAYRKSFLRALGFLVEAGETPVQALYLLVINDDKPTRKAEFIPAIKAIERSSSFTTALRELGLYDEPTIAILDAGERVGNLREAIASALSHLDTKARLKKMGITALTALSIDLSISISSVWGIQFYFLPMLAQTQIPGAKAEDIEYLQNALSLASAFNLTLLIVPLVAILIGLLLTFHSWTNRAKVDNSAGSFLARLPILRGFLLNAAIATTFSVAARMIEGHLPFDKAIKVAMESTAVTPVKAFWHNTIVRLEKGQDLRQAMSQSLVTPAERLIISSHQTFEQLARIIGSIAKERQEAAERGVKTMINIGILFAILYSFAAASNAIWIAYIQNENLTQGLNAIGGGMM